MDNDLLDKPGWKRFKKLAKRKKKMLRIINQAKLRSYRLSPRYKFGFEIPRDYEHALLLDKKNGNTRWKYSTELEMHQHDEYNTFEDLGPNGKNPERYKKIKVHLIYDLKHDGRHKARLVADGH